MMVKVMSLVIVMTFFISGLTSALADTTIPYDYHVNKTCIGQNCCIQSRDFNSNVMVNCRLKNMTHLDLDQLVPCPEIVYSLDISKNRLTNIEDAAFFRYRRLVKLDISYNALLTWNTSDITNQLPSLSELDVTGNPSWSPGQHIRDLPNITVIKGIASYTIPHLKHCIRCDLHKRESIVQGTGARVASTTYVCFEVEFSFVDNFTAIWGSKFSIKCQDHKSDSPLCDPTRQSHLGSLYYFIKLIDLCYQKLKWVIHNIVIGLVAMVINAIVITTILLSPSLRKNIDMLLIWQLSVADFLQGLYLVILASLYCSMSSSEYHDLKSSFYCESLSVLIQVAWCVGMTAGFLVTVDRYICVVYIMKPNVRISLTNAKVLIIIMWVIAIIVSSLPFALKIRPFFFDYSCASPRFPNGEYYTSYIGYVGAIVYVSSYILYIRIFYEVRKASLDVGIQREGRLAKRIMFVISSNVVFLLVPSVAGQFLTINNTENWVLKLIYWNAVVLSCFGINSCLNPLLYPFRCQRFTTELKRLLGFRKKIVGISKTNREAN
ncbi:uncharacterized protein LOC116301042 isoform X2 [Actinia tenebrosa]|uniref:Uncharacterized protein LOC116301042 isoform X2 n=1 Tax=Actinia tenebrosa TaxID=6105 RepID=A0A6P8IGX2_ACTTE|nr:uncharacterized protein LOC116301042 isoform X2 [Actinia tenebrosa]